MVNECTIQEDLILVQKKDYGLKVGHVEKENGILQDVKKDFIMDKLNQKNFAIELIMVK